MEWISMVADVLLIAVPGTSPPADTASADAFLWTNAAAGIAGGAALGAGRALLTALKWDHSLPTPKIAQMLVMHTVVILLFMFLGGLVAHYMDGVPGAFVTGTTALGFILLIGADSVGSRKGDDGSD